MPTPPFDLFFRRVSENINSLEVAFDAGVNEVLEETDFAGSKSVFDLFVAAVNTNMFASTPRQNQTMEITTLEWSSNVKGWVVHFNTKMVTPNAYLALVGLLCQIHFTDEPIQSVTFGLQDRITAEDVLKSGKPTPLVNYPFNIDESSRDFIADLEFIVDFESSLSNEKFENLFEFINIWDHVRILGGFDYSFMEAEALSALGSIAPLGPKSIMATIPNISLESIASRSFWNLLASDANNFRIKQVTVH